MFTTGFAELPRATMTDILANRLLCCDDTRPWIIARPLSGLAEALLFVVEGAMRLQIEGEDHDQGFSLSVLSVPP